MPPWPGSVPPWPGSVPPWPGSVPPWPGSVPASYTHLDVYKRQIDTYCEEFGVSAVAAAPAAAAGAAPAAEEKTEFDGVLAEVGANKMAVIKTVKEVISTMPLARTKAVFVSMLP